MQPRDRHLRPSLAHTIHFGVILLLLLLGLMIWMAMPLMNGIVDKARETRDVHLPAITQWRYNSQRADRLYTFINTLYQADNPGLIRRTRLESQVLVNGFAFEPDPQLAFQANEVMDAILRLAQLRTQQHQYQQRMSDRADQLRQISEQLENATSLPVAVMPKAVHVSHDLFALATTTKLTSHSSTDWDELISEIIRSRQLVSVLYRAPGSNADNLGHRLDELLQLQQDDASEILSLQGQAEDSYKTAILEQQRLSSLLNNDAALKTQELAERVEDDALQVQHLTWAFIGAFLLIGTVLLIIFNYLVLRPILRTSQVLEIASKGDPIPDVSEQASFFSEINAIAENVQRYGETSQELHRLNGELEKLSQLDGLTGIANRRQFDTCLNNELNRATRHQQTLALVLFDIDHFKQINDDYGHQQGDDCLRAFAQLLKGFAQRSGELAARYGGEEFALILPQLSLPDAIAIAEQIRVETPDLSILSKQGEPIRLNISAGVSFFDYGDQATDTELLEKADKALYLAKQRGRDRVETCDNNSPDSQII